MPDHPACLSQAPDRASVKPRASRRRRPGASIAGALFLPRVAAAPGSTIRVRIAAHEVILSRAAPEGLSALNTLCGTIAEIRPGHGPGALVVLALGETERLTARITQRAVTALGLEPGQTCHAILKSVAVAPEDLGRGRSRETTA